MILVNVRMFAKTRSDGAIWDIIMDRMNGPVEPVCFTVTIECNLAIWPTEAMSADCGRRFKYQVLCLNIWNVWAKKVSR